MQIKKWIWDFTNSDTTGFSNYFIRIGNKRYYEFDLKEIVKLHNKEIKYLQSIIQRLENDIAGDDL